MRTPPRFPGTSPGNGGPYRVPARNPLPTYRFHKSSGQAIVTVYNSGGSLRDILLGPFGSPFSREKYARICAVLLPGGVYASEGEGVPVSAVILAFWKHAGVDYRDPAGKPTSEFAELRLSLKVLRELHGDTGAATFGPKSLAAVRDRMIALGWCRPLVNKRVDRIKRMFKWATAEELVPPGVYEGLRALAGRSAAREPEPVAPVPEADDEAALPFLPRLPRAACELMRLTGMRPGETCRLTFGEVDTSGELWVYRPAAHKTRHHGRGRAILLGPRAQVVLSAFFAGLVRHGLLPADPPRRFSTPRGSGCCGSPSGGRDGGRRCSRARRTAGRRRRSGHPDRGTPPTPWPMQ